MLKNLKKDLLNQELLFIELDNYMMQNGFYSVFDDGIIEYIKHDLNVIYTAIETNAAEIQIFFNITINNGLDESPDAFYMKIIAIEKY